MAAVVRDRERAAAAPEMAVLSALAHGLDPDVGADVAFADGATTRHVDPTLTVLYLDLILDAVSDAVRAALEATMLPEGYEPKNPVLRRP